MIREFKKELLRLLKPLGYEVAFYSANPTKVFPHIVLNLPNSRYQEGLYTFALDVDLWDKSESSQNVDEMAIKVIDKLDRLIISTEKINAVIYLENIGDIGSQDPALKRKTIIFQIQIRRK